MEDGAEEPIPVSVETATSKKFALSSQVSPAEEPSSSRVLRSASHSGTSASSKPNDGGNLEGYRFVRCETLSQAIGQIGICTTCRAPLTLKEDMVTRRGLISKLSISCTQCDSEAVVSDPYAVETKSLNTRSVLAMREIGRGRSSLDHFLGLMDLPPPVTTNSYSEHNRRLAKVSMAAAEANMQAASAVLHQLCDARPTDIIDVTVTCDGTWSKRGFTATYGVVTVIAWETGQVLDFEIKSKRCTGKETQFS